MLREDEILNKLRDSAMVFRHYIERREYMKAALCADWAAMVALFVHLDDAHMAELFGDRQDGRDIHGGLFPESMRMMAGWWCIKHGHGITWHTYEAVMANAWEVHG